jgi:Family of unknown function (DUF6084)
MPNLTFAIEKAEVLRFGAVPTLTFLVRIENANPSEDVQSVALRCQILIEAAKRRYNPSERNAMRDLFGEPERWSQTLRSLLWCQVGVTVPPFTEHIEVELPVSCTFDFNVAAAKYFHGASSDETVPLCFQFSGTIFYRSANGVLQIEQISWDKEARFHLSARAWHELMDHYYPNSAWLRLERDVFERLYEYKRYHGLATWEQAIDRLLPLKKEAAS